MARKQQTETTTATAAETVGIGVGHDQTNEPDGEEEEEEEEKKGLAATPLADAELPKPRPMLRNPCLVGYSICLCICHTNATDDDSQSQVSHTLFKQQIQRRKMAEKARIEMQSIGRCQRLAYRLRNSRAVVVVTSPNCLIVVSHGRAAASM